MVVEKFSDMGLKPVEDGVESERGVRTNQAGETWKATQTHPRIEMSKGHQEPGTSIIGFVDL